MPQDNFLFSDTIARNIAFGDDSALADKERIYTAAETADIASDIRGFSKGFETVLGERGVTVSGGQKQRISIAKGILRNAPVLILDDSVSAVDTKTEKDDFTESAHDAGRKDDASDCPQDFHHRTDGSDFVFGKRPSDRSRKPQRTLRKLALRIVQWWNCRSWRRKERKKNA